MPTFTESLDTLRSGSVYKSSTLSRQREMELALSKDVRDRAQAARTQQIRTGGVGLRATEGIAAGTLGFLESASLGYGPPLLRAQASRMSGTSVPELEGLDLAVQKEFPNLYKMGNLAGNFVGPVAKGLGTVGRVVGRLGGIGGAAAGRGLVAAGVKPLAREFNQRLLTNFVSNLTGGAAAVATAEAARYREDAGLAQRLGDAAYATQEMAKNPLALGLFAGGSYVQTKLSRPPAAELASMRDRFERISGKRVPTEVLTDSADQRAAADALARIPGFQDDIAKQKTEMIAGLKATLEDIRSTTGAKGGGREALRGQAAQAVRGIVGEDVKSPVTAQRRGSMRAALEADATAQPLAAQILSDAVDAAKATRPRLAQSQMDGIFKEIQDIAKTGGKLNAEDLEELRQQVSGLAKYAKSPLSEAGARAGNRTDAEAGMLYDAITEAARRTTPNYYNALNLSKTLHRVEEALGDVPIRRIDDSQAAAFFKEGSTGDFPRRWQALVQNSTPDDISAIRGWYWYRLVRAVGDDRTHTISTKRLDAFLERPGSPFNSQIAETVLLPGGVHQLRQYAQFSENLLVKKGRFSAEGSGTAGRLAQYARPAAVMGSVATAAAVITGQITNPYGPIAGVLGAVGVRAAIRSAMGGLLENAMQNASRAGPTPFARSAVALHGQLRSMSPLEIDTPLGSLNLAGIPPRPPQILSSLPAEVGPEETP